MGLGYIGPVKIEWDGHLNPSFRWRSQADAANIRDAEISGYFDWAVAAQLSELSANTDAMPTTGGRKGVLVPIWADDELLGQFVGWYLLQPFDLEAPQESSLGGVPVAVSLQAAYLGDAPEVVVARSSVPKGNDFGLTAKGLVVSPLRPEDDAGDRFIVDPGGTFGTREYDPTYPYDPAVPTPAETAAIGLYVGTVTDTTDELATVCLPRLAWSKEAPKWLTQQGGMVRARDRRDGREVYGPHIFRESTDLWIGNGHVCAWAGNRGLVPFLNVQAFVDESWREAGSVYLGTTKALRRARMVRITAEDMVVALTIEDKGDALVILKRGEPAFHFITPPGVVPSWHGTPPTSRLVEAFNDLGHFGVGLDGTGDAYESSVPDIRLRWPPSLAKTAWTRVFWLSALQDSDLGDLGFWSLYDADGIPLVELFFDKDASTFRCVMDAQDIATPAASFDVDDDLCVALRFSINNGLAVTVLRPDGSVLAHALDTSAVAPPATAPYDFGYFVNFSRWGEDPDTWGPDDGVWGGETLWPGGVIDNDMLFERWLTDNELAALAVAETPLDGLPTADGGEATLVWYGPFDIEPVLMFEPQSDGRVEETEADERGVTRVVAYLDAARTESAALLARAAALDTAAAQHGQAAAENKQKIRLKG